MTFEQFAEIVRDWHSRLPQVCSAAESILVIVDDLRPGIIVDLALAMVAKCARAAVREEKGKSNGVALREQLANGPRTEYACRSRGRDSRNPRAFASLRRMRSALAGGGAVVVAGLSDTRVACSNALGEIPDMQRS